MNGYDGLKSLARGKSANLGPCPKIRRILKGHFGKIYSLHWASNSKDLVSAGQDGKLIVWDALINAKLHAIPLRSTWVMTCAFEQSASNAVACGGLDNICSIYHLNSQSQNRSYRELAGHDGYLSCCRFVNQKNMLTSSGDASCIYWDIESNKAIQTFIGHDSDVMSLSIKPEVDPNMFVSGSVDNLAKVWDTRVSKCVMTFRGHESDINSVALFPDTKAFGTGSDDSTCRVFDIRACGELCEFKSDMLLCGITSIAFSKSGRLLFAGYDDYNCLAWDLLGNTEKPVYELKGHENRVSSVGVAPNGDAICTGSWDSILKVWA